MLILQQKVKNKTFSYNPKLRKELYFGEKGPTGKTTKEVNAEPKYVPSGAFPGFVHSAGSPWSGVLA